MPVIRASNALDFELQGNRVTGFAAPSRGATETMTYRISLNARGALPEHRHDHEEVFHVISGSLTSVLDGEEQSVGAGDTVIIPAGTPHHAFTGSDPAVLLVAMPVGTMFIRPTGERSMPPWGE